MENLMTRLITHNWQRKLVALIIATLVWFFVDNSISETKVIPSVPIRVINLPEDKTVLGLLPNGTLIKRITLTLTGSKDVIHQLEPGDLVIVIDASAIDRDEWVMQINKKNLVSLNPAIDLAHHINEVSHPEYILKLAKLVTEKIPITINPPSGEAPLGYEFLDIWPQRFMQTISGPEEAIRNLKSKGLELSFDLQNITKANLDSIKTSHSNVQDDEISFLVPDAWKMITIPFQNNAIEEINDPEAQFLRIDFLRKDYHKVGDEVPIGIFYPLKYASTLNPENLHLGIAGPIEAKNGIPVLKSPLYLYGVSRLFAEIIRDYIYISIIAAPIQEREILQWGAETADPRALEDTYAAFMINNTTIGKNSQSSILKSREAMLRRRFREYMQKLILYRAPDHKLNLENHIQDESIIVNIEK